MTETMQGPIFIGGLSYSGKTYLRLMLNAHPHLAITRRSKMWPRYYGRFGDLADPANLERCLTAMLRSKGVQALQPDPNRIRREFAAGVPTYARLFALFHAHHAERAGRRRWGDQLGGVEAYADPIFAAYPGAVMVHMVRDPRARLAVNARDSRHRRARLGWETAAWRRSARLARRNARRYSRRYRVVHYEALLGRPRETLADICSFLGERFVPEMLTTEAVAPILKEYRERGDSGRIAPPMDRRELALLQASVGREMKKLHYDPQELRLSARDYLFLPTVDWPLNVAGQAMWWATAGRRQLKELRR